MLVRKCNVCRLPFPDTEAAAEDDYSEKNLRSPDNRIIFHIEFFTHLETQQRADLCPQCFRIELGKALQQLLPPSSSKGEQS